MSYFFYLWGELLRWLYRRQQYIFRPLSGVHEDYGIWRCENSDPALSAVPKSGLYPRGWYILEIKIDADSSLLPSKLYVDYGEGFSESEIFPLNLESGRMVKRLCYFPSIALALRFDPCEFPENIQIKHFVFARVTKGFARRVMVRKLQVAGLKGELEVAALDTLWDRYRKLFVALRSSDYDAHLLEERKRYPEHIVTARLNALKVRPLISIVVPVYNPPISLLEKCIDSVKAQSYPYWQLCLADDCSPNAEVAKVLNRYAREDSRIQWVRRTENGHICKASNSGLALATGEYVAFLDHDDELFQHALLEVVSEINSNPLVDIIYSDEDFIDLNGRRFAPHYKSDWNPALLLSHNYVTHLVVYRRNLINKLGNFREEAQVDGAQDYDLLLRAWGQTESDRIVHIPKILYHWRAHEGSTALGSDQKSYTSSAGLRALKNYFQERGIEVEVCETDSDNLYRVKYPLKGNPLVSLLIPTRDMLSVLKPCVESILNRSTYRNFEILILDNQSQKKETLEWFEKITELDHRIKIVEFDHPFNYSAINNYGVRHARGEILGLINNDIEVITPDWLEEMVSLAQRPENGCVGALLYYPDDTVQHAGVILGLGGYAAHSHRGVPRGSQGYFNRLKVRQNVSAVTGACLFVRKDVYKEVSGLDESFEVAYNDVDFCLRVQQAGYYNVFTPFAELYHHESKSRGEEDTPEKIARFDREKAQLAQRWCDLLKCDPFYNPNLTRSREDFSLK
ncbi:glycosyltransferase family 2 protein [Microbulbifer thermotolerans]|uniref:Glycosyltransferase family 2 protein n=1 Tax=Microbulbifer thermotolerans TaxID=252514 RepID=A0AB35I2X8_MICTH|nr:glycosyltransferase family 2 protein [Microbulbifer thermotolerans]MCX2803346.1 glycosyltransferase family 2 protein [Microbulbifer thermotolerans]